MNVTAMRLDCPASVTVSAHFIGQTNITMAESECEACNLTVSNLRESIISLKAELKEKDKLIMAFTTITTQASHIAAMKNCGCSYNLNATRPRLHGHSAPGLDNDPTLPWVGTTVTGVPDPKSTPALPDDP